MEQFFTFSIRYYYALLLLSSLHVLWNKRCMNKNSEGEHFWLLSHFELIAAHTECSTKKCNFCLRLCFIQYVRQSNVSKYQESTEFRNRRKIIIHALTRILYKTLPLIIENIYTRQVSLKKALAFPVKIFLVENIVWTLNKTNVMNKTVIMTKVESMLFIYSFYLFTC